MWYEGDLKKQVDKEDTTNSPKSAFDEKWYDGTFKDNTKNPFPTSPSQNRMAQ